MTLAGATTLKSQGTTNGAQAVAFSGMGYREIVVLLSVLTAPLGTTPTLSVQLQTLGPDGAWYNVGAATATVNAVGQTSYAYGVGASGTGGTALPFGDTCRITYTIAGTTPSFDFTVSVIGK